MSRRVRVVPGRGSSMFGIVAGVVMLFVVLGAVGNGAPGGVVLIPLAAIGISAYNAFGRGIATHEVEIDDDRDLAGLPGSGYCPQCGTGIATGDRFCRSCGNALTA